MPRPRTLSNEDILEAAHMLMHARGPEALTFEALGRACGLSPATLVQRFGNKAALKQATLVRAWDRLDRQTGAAAASLPKTPAGAIDLLVSLSGSYGEIEAYAEGLLVLREDLRDPALRRRGAAWKAALSTALDACFTGTPGAPRGIGLIMAAQWQGALLWWSFEPKDRIEDHVRESLRHFIETVLPAARG